MDVGGGGNLKFRGLLSMMSGLVVVSDDGRVKFKSSVIRGIKAAEILDFGGKRSSASRR